MAIIPLYYVVASSVDVDPDTLDIKEGQCVALNGAAGGRRVTTGDDGRVFVSVSLSPSLAPGASSTSIAAQPVAPWLLRSSLVA